MAGTYTIVKSATGAELDTKTEFLPKDNTVVTPALPQVFGGATPNLSRKRIDEGLIHWWKDSVIDVKSETHGVARGGYTENFSFVTPFYYGDWDSTNGRFLTDPETALMGDYDGTADTGVTYPGTESFDLVTSEYTWTGWIYPDVNGGYILAKSGSDSSTRTGFFMTGSTLQARIGGGTTFNLRDFVIVNRAHFLHFNLRIVNGVPTVDFAYDGVIQIQGKTTELGTGTNIFPLSSGGRHSGTDPATDTLTTLFDGKIWDLKIYDKVIPIEHTRGLYANYKSAYVVAAMGDSQLQGNDGPTTPANAWYWKTASALETVSPDILFLNMGVGGYNSYQGVPDNFVKSEYITGTRTAQDTVRNATYLARDLYADAIVACYTSNDASEGFIDGPNLAYEVMYNLSRMSAEANTYGTSFITVSAMPTADTNKAANKLLADQQKSNVEHLINFFDLLYDTSTGFLKDEFQKVIPDGTHVNDYAHTQMSNIATRRLFEILNLQDYLYPGAGREHAIYDAIDSATVGSPITWLNGVPTIFKPDGLGFEYIVNGGEQLYDPTTGKITGVKTNEVIQLDIQMDVQASNPDRRVTIFCYLDNPSKQRVFKDSVNIVKGSTIYYYTRDKIIFCGPEFLKYGAIIEVTTDADVTVSYASILLVRS